MVYLSLVPVDWGKVAELGSDGVLHASMVHSLRWGAAAAEA